VVTVTVTVRLFGRPTLIRRLDRKHCRSAPREQFTIENAASIYLYKPDTCVLPWSENLLIHLVHLLNFTRVSNASSVDSTSDDGGGRNNNVPLGGSMVYYNCLRNVSRVFSTKHNKPICLNASTNRMMMFAVASFEVKKDASEEILSFHRPW